MQVLLAVDELAKQVGAPVQSADHGLKAFLQRGSEALEYLEARTAVQLQPVATYPDYYPDRPGATPGARVLEPRPFDARTLGAQFIINETWGVVGEVEAGDLTSQYMLGVRASF